MSALDKRPPSSTPEDIQPLPSTPELEEPKLETSDFHSETARGTPFALSREPTSPGTPSLLLATTGVGLVQLFAVASTTSTPGSALAHIQHFACPLGATLVGVGLLVLTIGVRRYFLIQTLLTKGVFPVTRFTIAGLTLIFAVITIVVFGLLVSARN
ncbi:putative protein with domain of unknown function (DUF202) [Lyophyllum shimeji]|uniref:DUF202 domain-containing protein n=1 Tax=Lyophyllum shimeji TaxID=47721 RepID=A0A9P3PLX4_LYOSH|nr:putative protein with domain of unknown function (DUF202) [Lyophyllum shimeji]